MVHFSTARKFAFAVITSLVTAALLAAGPAAFAADKTLSFTENGRNWQATWDDSADNLCATKLANSNDVTRLRARLVPSNGSGSSFSASTTKGSGFKQSCTGNLSIPEDKAYVMTLSWYDENTAGWQVIRTATIYS